MKRLLGILLCAFAVYALSGALVVKAGDAAPPPAPARRVPVFLYKAHQPDAPTPSALPDDTDGAPPAAPKRALASDMPDALRADHALRYMAYRPADRAG